MNLPLVLLNRRRRGGLDAYREGGFNPALVFDFDDEYYRTGGSTSTFSDAITHSRSSNATMVDSDGLLKWAPHNLFLRSEEFDNAAWSKTAVTVTADAVTDPLGTNTADKVVETVVNSAHLIFETITLPAGTHTISVYLKAAELDKAQLWFGVVNSGASFDLTAVTSTEVTGFNSPDSHSITDEGNGWRRCSVTYTLPSASSVAASVYLSRTGNFADRGYTGDGTSGIYLWGAHLYRSDLGGMVDNPDRGDSYVPTTSSARYLARRGHHIWNGSAWVNEGMLHESESRVNLVTYSNDFTDASWSKTNTATLAVDAIGPDGETSAVTLVDSGATGSGSVLIDSANITVATSTNYTVSVFAKADQLSWMRLGARNFTSTAEAWFNLSTGEVGTTAGAELVTQGVEDFGNGWYRCYVVFTSDAADTVGNVRIVVGDGDNDATVDLDGTSSILIYGAQFEAGSTPSSYIPTSGATVTRAADTLTVPSANLPWPTPNVIGPEKWTTPTISDPAVWSWDGSTLIGTGDGTSDTAIGDDLIAGSVYKVSFDLASTSGLFQVRLGTGVFIATLGGTTTQSYSYILVATGTGGLRFTDSGSFVGTISNISVREIDPLAVSIQMQGRMTYADTGASIESVFSRWTLDANNRIEHRLDTNSAATGQVTFLQTVSGTNDIVNSPTTAYSPGINVPFNVASRHGSTFINGAVDGTALTADTTPVALPDLSSTDLNLGFDYMGTIKLFRIWAADLADAGIATASAPSLEPSLLLTFDGSEGSFTVSDWSE